VTRVVTNQTTTFLQSHPVTKLATLPSSATANKQQCYESYINWLMEIRSSSRARELVESSLASDPSKVRRRALRTLQTVFVTIQKFGVNETYSTCDEIPRLRFLATPNVTSTKVFSLHYRQHASWEFVSPYDSWVRTVTRTVPSPNCQLDTKQCINLWAANQQYWGVKKDPVAESLDYFLVGPLACTNHYPACNLHMGNEVVLLYWPPKLESRDICGLDGAGYAKTVPYPSDVVVTTVMNAITFQGKERYGIPVREVADPRFNVTAWMQKNSVEASTLSGPFTFTSPSLYVAHRQIVMESIVDVDMYSRKPKANANLRIVRTLSKGGIIRVRPEDVYSVHPILESEPKGLEFAQLVAHGKFNPVRTGVSPNFDYTDDFWSKTTVPIDFGQVKDPVPASVYYMARSEDCWVHQTHCGTITDDTYQPELFIRGIWSSLLPNNIEARTRRSSSIPNNFTSTKPGRKPRCESNAIKPTRGYNGR
jgi:hypothetical protein